MKAKVKTNGIILKSTPYSDTSLVFSVFTCEYGLISVIAKGIRKKNAENPLIVLYEYQFNLYPPLETGLFLFSDASLMREFDVFNRAEAWAAAEAGAELLSQMIIPHDEVSIYYELLRQYLSVISDTPQNCVFIWWRFIRRVFSIMGIDLQTDNCTECESEGCGLLAFDKVTGHLLCKECLEGRESLPSTIVFGAEVSEILHLLPQIGHYLDRIVVSRATVRELNSFFCEYFESRYNKTLKLKSLSVLEQFYPV